ncbi:MAG: glutamate racemase [Candidatus Omnitrophica bacterium CG07_land_8_20_14_0_80_42_15]|uniref:Glutamate racemase n=1 Tax=Candidatus Aquitaenariimonas noxiae TaxID=1974741 RepID=A0A2J0KWN7_9BACT|nr:MAG: glutamate racemase [Candidatus Omnitrophica bacterium CG07_land_8_20_14_0_80_42_15]
MDLQNRPIGVFDSGLGGLTTVKEIFKRLPNENIVYFGDTARVPYGSKSKETITQFSIENTQFLLKFNAKLIVVACNTSSSLSLNSLKAHFKVPIIGVIAPGVKKAMSVTKNNRIGVIGTRATIASKSYEKEIKKRNSVTKCLSRSCPLFVPLVEEDWIGDEVTYTVARRYLQPLMKYNIDTLILGCTHYPLLKGVIKRVVGKKVNLVDSAEEVALDAKRLLEARRLLSKNKNARHKFFVSDKPMNFKAIGERFLGRKISFIKKV